MTDFKIIKWIKLTIVAISNYFPMLMVSTAMHLFILFIVSLIPVDNENEQEKEVVIISEIVQNIAEDAHLEMIEKIEIDKTEIEVIEEINEKPEDEPENIVDVLYKEDLEIVSEQDLEEISLLPSSYSLDSQKLSMIGLKFLSSIKNNSFIPTGYSHRTGYYKTKALARLGGDNKTEAAVSLALNWLALHQENDGSWDSIKYEGKQRGIGQRIYTTACALLPFLGAGHSESSGEYRNVVKKGVRYLNTEINKHYDKPHFGNNYGTALVLMALSEATIFGSSISTKKNANRVAMYLMEQYLESPGQGWRYHGAGDDFSVSGWVSLGLKSAQAASLSAMNSMEAKTVMEEYKKWSLTMTDENTGLGKYRPDSKPTPHMTWVGMFIKQSLGFDPRKDLFLKKASENSIDWTLSGKWVGTKKPGPIYGIYYATLATFQQQGKTWQVWNEGMKKTLVSSQRQGNPDILGGAWDPTSDHTGEFGGRIFTTAIMALCLEVYYRYEVMNLN